MGSKSMIVRDTTPTALGPEDYYETVADKAVFRSTALNLRVYKGVMSKLETSKNALTGIQNKMVVLWNQNCAPFVYGLDAVTGYRVDWPEEEEPVGIDCSQIYF